jgi:hypothetical protein
MKYTNGFDLDAILPAIKGRVGWRSDSPEVRSFESFHALCTEQNLRDVQPTANISDSDFSDYKDTLEDDIIKRCLSGVFSQPEYIEQVLLHKRIDHSTNQVIENTGLFCGIRIRVAPAFDVSVAVKAVTLLFDGVKTFDLYLFKEGQNDFLHAWEVTTVANTPTVVELEELILNYARDGATTFYLGYFQDDLGSVRAIREMVCYDSTKAFAGISMQAQRNGTGGIRQENISYVYESVGLNLEVHSFRDYTRKIVRSPELFDEVIGLSMAYFLLELIVSSTRANSTERTLLGSYEAIEIKHYLYGAVPAMGVAKTTGLNEIIAQKFESVRRSFYPVPKAQTVSLC